MISPDLQKTLALVPNAGKIGQSSTPAADTTISSSDPTLPGKLYIGHVVRAGAGLYDVAVQIGNSKHNLPCTVLTQACSTSEGTSQAFIPTEGTQVMVYMDSPTSMRGTVLGVIPGHDTYPPSESAKRYVSIHNKESGGSPLTESLYSRIIKDGQDFSKINSLSRRPAELVPGNYLFRNEQGCGLALNRLSSSMFGSERSEIRTSAIDDQVRIISGHYIHFNALGTDQRFNDGGYLTSEQGISTHQCERSGLKQYGDKLFKKTEPNPLLTMLTSGWKAVKARLVPKKRLQTFTGFLGDIFHMFVANPDPAVARETEDNKSNDQGLMQMHLDTSGRVTLRTASGLSLQRWDRIPVPKRIRQPWDPKGRKVEDGMEPTEKKPFVFDTRYPEARSLQLRDALAYKMGQAYERIGDLAKGDKTDFYLPEEDETKVPADLYDEPGKAKGTFGANKGRQASINLEEDGSIILRDAWGSEIAMRGGNITITCAGDVNVRPGKSIIAMAGHDAVMKARKSVDISATDNDIRMYAGANMMVAATGILVESTGIGESVPGSGEQAALAGVVVKAVDSTVSLQARTVHVSGSNEVNIETFSDDRQGTVNISTGTLNCTSRLQSIFTAKGTSSLVLNEFQAMLAGNSVVMASANDLQLTRNTEMGIIEQWATIKINGQEVNPYERLQTTVQPLYDWLQSNFGWVAPYTPEHRGDYKFTFRSSKEYGTLSPSEIGGTVFTVTQAVWAYLAQAKYATLGDTEIELWEDDELNGTLPWPGKQAVNSYLVLSRENNIKDPATGIPVARKDLKPEGGPLTLKPIGSYEAVKHT